MSVSTILIFALVLLALISALLLAYYFFFVGDQSDLRVLMGGPAQDGAGSENKQPRGFAGKEADAEDFDRIKRQTKRRFSSSANVPLEDKYFHAGIFTDEEKAKMQRLRIVSPIAFALGFLGLCLYLQIGSEYTLVGLVMGILIGLQFPKSVLERRIKARAEDILFYLPLVIEQIAIGVSSSLDIGPCLQRVVQMADERDSHNVVTELVRQAQFYIRSGIPLEDAMTEVGRRSGQVELKHAFMSLAQVARHGGEITRQLQELADAVASQREAKIEGKIKKLELEATGPVALVFMGFLIILLIGFGIQIKGAFGG